MLNSKAIQAIFKASPTPKMILLPDAQSTIVEANEAYLRVTNTTEDDLLGRPLFDAFPGNPDEPDGDKGVEALKAALQQMITTKKANKVALQRYDTPIRGTNEFERKYWIQHNHPVFDEHGEIDFVIHSPIDVTKRVLAEEKNKVAREQLQEETRFRKSIQQELWGEKNFAEELINSLPGTFFLFDEQGKMHRWNKNLEKVTGYTSDEIKQMQPLMFIPDERIEIVRESIKETFRSGKAEVEATIRSKNGKELPFYFNAKAIKLNGKNFVIGTGSDISELIKERTQKMWLSQILEKSRNEIYIFNEKTLRFIYVNAGARENLGYTLNELKRMTPMDIIAEDDLKKKRQFKKLLREKTTEKSVFNIKNRRADGSLYDVEVHLQLIRQDGNCVFAAIILDISERLEIEDQVKASLHEKEVLLNEIHHRVKNNLAIVSSLLHLQSQNVDDPVVKTILAESEGRVQSMALIHELLYKQDDFSNIDFNVYIKKLMEIITANYKTPGVPITTGIKAVPVRLEISTAVPCALIINELLTNAYKHAFKGRDSGNIYITMNCTGDNYTLIVRDDGIGLPVNLTRSTLGLTLIHGLARQISGTVTSKTGEGTAFTIEFPVKQAG